MTQPLHRIGLWLLLTLLASAGWARDDQFQKHGDYTVYYTLFPSTFLQADIAAAYDLVRGEDIMLLNVSVNAKGSTFGQAVELRGTQTNLIQQQRILEFQAIKEGEAVYYIAPVKVASKEPVHFRLQVTPPDTDTFEIKFTRNLHKE